MKNVDSEAIAIPKSFQLACQLFGIKVADFLQLYVNHFSYIDLHFDDKSVYSLVTKSFDYVIPKQEEDKHKLNIELTAIERDKGVKLVQRQIKLAMNRNYSYSQRRMKGKLLTNQLYDLFSKDCEIKNVIYLDEETKITLNKDLMFRSLVSGISATQFLNGIMQCVAIPDYLARIHLNKSIYNPVLGVFIRVFDGYGSIRDKEFQDSVPCREMMMEIQELNKRYFFCRDVDERKAHYQGWLNNYLENNSLS
ncbi:hypothetical protein HCX49_23340 [Sphingobacterium kitahiroshimense]|uniref:hypothetical protein n=1 Tax=Sphingobacterium sp. B16(2022) TaxID=2914044 RepID=UPI001438C694|nr:hypothetical protein [Sphingobacterium sp. B16(2022)]NJI76131.1 hypothetical protein [Sphingobacterium sp. B16(2022)]